MGIAYSEDFATTVAKSPGVIKEKILASSDWAHLAVASSVTVATSTIASGATSGTASGSVATGAVMTFWRSTSDNGSATPECRVNTGGGGTSIAWTDPLTAPNGTYQVGDKIGIGTYCKATTTRNAQMVVDLADSAVTAQRLQLGVYRTHDGTTGVDKLTRYLYWKTATGATTDILRTTVSAGKEHLFIAVEGPRAPETNAESATYGSYKQLLALSDIVPYYSSTYDNTPAVLLVGNALTQAQSQSQRAVWSSRDAPNNASWVAGSLLTLASPFAYAVGGVPTNPVTFQPVGLDGSLVMRPWVVDEDQRGLRGTLARFFYGGAVTPNVSGDPAFLQPGQEVTYGGVTYHAIQALKSPGSSAQYLGYGFGQMLNYQTYQAGPILFVPKA